MTAPLHERYAQALQLIEDKGAATDPDELLDRLADILDAPIDEAGYGYVVRRAREAIRRYKRATRR